VEPFLSALLGAAVTLTLQGVLTLLTFLKESRGGEFSGVWFGVLPASGGKTDRHERMVIRLRGNAFHATIRRISPRSEAGRKWLMRGYVHGNVLVAEFHTTAPKMDPSSYGVLVLHRDPNKKDAIVWRGYYERPDSNNMSEVVNFEVERHPLSWQRIDPQSTVH